MGGGVSLGWGAGNHRGGLPAQGSRQAASELRGPGLPLGLQALDPRRGPNDAEMPISSWASLAHRRPPGAPPGPLQTPVSLQPAPGSHGCPWPRAFPTGLTSASGDPLEPAPGPHRLDPQTSREYCSTRPDGLPGAPCPPPCSPSGGPECGLEVEGGSPAPPVGPRPQPLDSHPTPGAPSGLTSRVSREQRSARCEHQCLRGRSSRATSRTLPLVPAPVPRRLGLASWPCPCRGGPGRGSASPSHLPLPAWPWPGVQVCPPSTCATAHPATGRPAALRGRPGSHGLVALLPRLRELGGRAQASPVPAGSPLQAQLLRPAFPGGQPPSSRPRDRFAWSQRKESPQLVLLQAS